MAKRVAKIQMRPLAFLKLIRNDDRSLDRDVVGDQLGQIRDVELERPINRLFESRESFGVANDVMLDALGEPASKLARGVFSEPQDQ